MQCDEPCVQAWSAIDRPCVKAIMSTLLHRCQIHIRVRTSRGARNAMMYVFSGGIIHVVTLKLYGSLAKTIYILCDIFDTSALLICIDRVLSVFFSFVFDDMI